MIKAQAANAAAGERMIAALSGYSKIAQESTGEVYLKTTSNRLRSELSEAFGMYVDARARARPKSFHHVYEWGMVGQPSGRLFQVTGQNHGSASFSLGYKLLPSSVPVSALPGGDHVFRMKAEIMENQVTVVIRPINARMLVFDVDGRTIFTPGPVTVTTPGGRAVANSMRDAFSGYFNPAAINSNPVYQNVINNASKTITDRLKKARV